MWPPRHPLTPVHTCRKHVGRDVCQRKHGDVCKHAAHRLMCRGESLPLSKSVEFNALVWNYSINISSFNWDSQPARLSSGIRLSSHHPGNSCDTSVKYLAWSLVLAAQWQQQQHNKITSQTSSFFSLVFNHAHSQRCNTAAHSKEQIPSWVFTSLQAVKSSAVLHFAGFNFKA